MIFIDDDSFDMSKPAGDMKFEHLVLDNVKCLAEENNILMRIDDWKPLLALREISGDVRIV